MLVRKLFERSEMNIIIVSVIVAVLVLAAGIWFARPFMDRANRRLEKTFEKYSRLRNQDAKRLLEDYKRSGGEDRVAHFLNTFVDMVLAAVIAFGVSYFVDRSAWVFLVCWAIGGVVVFQFVVVPIWANRLANKNHIYSSPWWLAPVVFLIGANPVKWYGHGLYQHRRCLNFVRFFHVFCIVALLLRWRRDGDGEEEDWGSGR